MAWTTAGTFYNAAGGGTVTNTTIGNLRVVWAGATVQPVVTGGGVTVWYFDVYHATQNTAFLVIYYGLVTATGAQTLAITHTPFETMSQEFAPPAGPPTHDGTGNLSNATGGAFENCASITPSGAGDLWTGYMIAASVTAGNSTGVSYHATHSGDELGWNLNAPSGAYTANLAPTGGWDSIASMFAPAVAVTAIKIAQII